MNMTIVLRKEVADETEAQDVYKFVCDKLREKPAITISGQVNSQLELEVEP